MCILPFFPPFVNILGTELCGVVQGSCYGQQELAKGSWGAGLDPHGAGQERASGQGPWHPHTSVHGPGTGAAPTSPLLSHTPHFGFWTVPSAWPTPLACRPGGCLLADWLHSRHPQQQGHLACPQDLLCHIANGTSWELLKP